MRSNLPLRRRRWWRCCGYPDPLPGLGHAVAIEDVSAVWIDHLTLDRRGWRRCVGWRPRIDHRRRGIRDVIVGVRIGGGHGAKGHAADKGARPPPTTPAAAAMEAMMEAAVEAATSHPGIARHGSPREYDKHREEPNRPLLHLRPPSPIVRRGHRPVHLSNDLELRWTCWRRWWRSWSASRKECLVVRGICGRLIAESSVRRTEAMLLVVCV